MLHGKVLADGSTQDVFSDKSFIEECGLVFNQIVYLQIVCVFRALKCVIYPSNTYLENRI